MSAVCVYCSSSNAIEQGYLDLAHEVGAQLGRRGHSLISGGGRVGMMGAVANGAREYGAHTLGVIPQHLVAHEVADHDADDLLIVDTMRDRKAIMDAHADLFLVLPGGIGTLEEFFEIWTAGTLGMHPKDVIVLDYGDFFRPLWDFVGNLVESGFARPAIWESVQRVSTVDEAFALIDRHKID
jgi:uncharacterized protein (TIGR00730 family)